MTWDLQKQRRSALYLERSDNMKMIIEYFVSFLFLMFFIWVGISYSFMNSKNTAARDYQAACVRRIEDSHLNETVINDCKQKAEDDGYQLNVNKCVVYDNSADALVTLSYNYKIPIINSEKSIEITSYAR